MENTHPLATESFSYSWLTDDRNPRPAAAGNPAHTFNFDVSFPASPVHADEIFSGGHLMPLYPRLAASTTSFASVPPSPAPFAPEVPALAKWRKTSKKVLARWLGFLHQSLRRRNRVDDLDRKFSEIGNSPRRPSSAHSAIDWSDVKRMVRRSDHRRRPAVDCLNTFSPPPPSADAECSIREAILYCKKSIGYVVSEN